MGMNKAAKIQTQIDNILHGLNAIEHELDDFANEHMISCRTQLSLPGEFVLQDGEGTTIAFLIRDDNFFWSLVPSDELDKLQFPE